MCQWYCSASDTTPTAANGPGSPVPFEVESKVISEWIPSEMPRSGKCNMRINWQVEIVKTVRAL